MSFRHNATARPRNAGFVLIEVLVAVGVAAVLMAVLIRSFSQTWSGIGMVREEAEAALIGRSMLQDLAQRSLLAAGTQEGAAGRYSWKMTTIAVPLPPPPAPQPDSQGDAASAGASPAPSTLYHIVLVLRGPSGRSNRLDTFELGPPAQ